MSIGVVPDELDDETSEELLGGGVTEVDGVTSEELLGGGVTELDGGCCDEEGGTTEDGYSLLDEVGCTEVETGG